VGISPGVLDGFCYPAMPACLNLAACLVLTAPRHCILRLNSCSLWALAFLGGAWWAATCGVDGRATHRSGWRRRRAAAGKCVEHALLAYATSLNDVTLALARSAPALFLLRRLRGARRWQEIGAWRAKAYGAARAPRLRGCGYCAAAAAKSALLGAA